MRLLLLLLLGLLWLPLAVAGPAVGEGGEGTEPGRATVEQEPTSVYVGLYLRDISRFALEEGRFEADLDAWMKWTGDAEPPPLRFANGELDTREVVERESDGDWHSVRWHVQGTFRGRFDLHEFPYDRQPVEVVVELPGEELLGLDGRAFRLLPDAAASGMAADFSLTGWLYERAFAVRQLQTRLASDLGSIRHEGRPTVGQAVAFRVLMTRPFTSYLIKFLLPLGIIVVLSMTVFWVEEDRLDVRSSIGVTGVLSCIAFHFTQADTLPDVAYLVRADRLFLLAYLCVALALVETLVVHWFEESRPRLAHRMDLASRLLFPLVFLGATAAILRPQAEVIPESAAEAWPERLELRSHDELLRIYRSSSKLYEHYEHLTYRELGPRFGADGLQVHEPPWLLEVVPDVSNDLVRLLPDGGMEVTWRLREGLRWSDGHPMDSGDLAFTQRALGGAAGARVEVLDGFTTRVTWPGRSADHLAGFRLLPEHALADAWSQGQEVFSERRGLASTPGDGPYVFVERREDGVSVYRRNPHYAGEEPRIAELQVCGGRDSSCNDPRKLDYWQALSTTSLGPVLEANAGYRELVVDASHRPSHFLFMLHVSGLPVFSTVESRRLLLGAIDRQRIVESEATAVLTDRFAALPGPEEPAAYAPEAARPLLSRFTRPRPLSVLCRDTSGGIDQLVCEVVVQSLEAAGATVAVTRVSTTDRYRYAKEEGWPGIIVFQAGGDPRELVPYVWNIRWEHGVADFARAFSPAWSPLHRRLADLMRGSLYRERRQAALAELGRRYVAELPTIPLTRLTASSAWDPRLRGVRPDSGEMFGFVEDWYTITPEQLAAERAAVLPGGPQVTP